MGKREKERERERKLARERGELGEGERERDIEIHRQKERQGGRQEDIHAYNYYTLRRSLGCVLGCSGASRVSRCGHGEDMITVAE